MKKLNYIFALAAIAAVACTKKADVEMPKAIDSFTVSMGEVKNEGDTKTELIWDGEKYNKLVWTAGDKLYVTRASVLGNHGTDFPYATFETSNNQVTEAIFTKAEGSIDIPGTGKYVVMYTSAADYGHVGALLHTTDNDTYCWLSVPVNQSYVENGIGQGVMPMIGRGDSLDDIRLECAGNILRFNLYNSDALTTAIKITRIVLTASDNTLGNIGGIFNVNTTSYPSSGVLYGLYKHPSSSQTVTLDCGAGVTLETTPTPFNIVVTSHRGASGSTDISSTSVSATIYYTVDDGTEQPYGPVTLSKLTGTKRNSLGNIYSFTAKDAAAF